MMALVKTNKQKIHVSEVLYEICFYSKKKKLFYHLYTHCIIKIHTMRWGDGHNIQKVFWAVHAPIGTEWWGKFEKER